jgi:hypothetical protein
MSAGITRIHGTALTGTSNTQNVTGSQGSFLSGYQQRFFDITANYTSSSNLEAAILKIQTVASVTFIGVPSSTHTIIGVDAASFTGRGDYTGYGAEGNNAEDTLASLLSATVNEVIISGNAFTSA